MSVYVPPDVMIGHWEISIKTIKGSSDYEFIGVNDVIVLFNPWCPDDQVYYKGDQQELNEYILNESGANFTGNQYSINSSSWFYGQV